MKFNNLYFKPYKDMFNIYNNIRKINRGYRLFFNIKNNKFAVVNIYKNFEICKEYSSIFENIEQDLRFFKIENYNNIIQFIDECNYKSITNNNKNIKQSCSNFANEISIISSRSNKISENDFNKLIGEIKC